MKLNELVKDKWTICEIADTGSTMADFYKVNKGSTKKLYALLTDVASRVNGPIKYNNKIIHEINKKKGLYQFIKGDLRVPFFLDRNKVIICTHGFFKNTSKTPAKQKKEALNYKNEYFENKELNLIKVYNHKNEEIINHVIQRNI